MSTSGERGRAEIVRPARFGRHYEIGLPPVTPITSPVM